VESFLGRIDVGTVAIKFVVLLFSLSIHEAAHAWMADRCGDYTARYLGRVTINPIPHIDLIGTVFFPLLQFFTPFPLLGWAKPVPINSAHLHNPKRDQVLVSLAGPGANLLASGAAFLILFALKQSWFNANLLISEIARSMHIPGNSSILAPLLGILFFTVITNLILAIFNCIPIPPLDGHWFLYRILPQSAASVLERFGSYGFLLIYLLMFRGAFNFIYLPIEWIRSFLI
jgi:Zn-dependent protease